MALVNSSFSWLLSLCLCVWVQSLIVCGHGVRCTGSLRLTPVTPYLAQWRSWLSKATPGSPVFTTRWRWWSRVYPRVSVFFQSATGEHSLLKNAPFSLPSSLSFFFLPSPLLLLSPSPFCLSVAGIGAVSMGGSVLTASLTPLPPPSSLEIIPRPPPSLCKNVRHTSNPGSILANLFCTLSNGWKIATFMCPPCFN